MKTRIGINGFGRIGRLLLRAGSGDDSIEFVRINDPHATSESAAHLLEFDTVHGRWSESAEALGEAKIVAAGHEITFSREATIEAADWSDCDIVLEASGKFRTVEPLQSYLAQGVSKVIVAAPVKKGALNIVMGCNDHLYDPAEHHIVTAASCTTNCVAPVIKVLHEQIGIRHGMLTTMHDLTNTQTIVDAPHADLRRARSAVNSLIPTTTGSATAVTQIFPELAGRLNGVAVRVPLLNASLTDLVVELERPTTVEEVNEHFQTAAKGDLAGILGYEEKPLVSADYVNDPRSGIVDALSTMVVNDTQLKVLVWYDNEWGYANRMMELCQKAAADL